MTAFRTLWRTDLRRGLHQLRLAFMVLPLVVVLMAVTQDDWRTNVALVLGGTSVIYVAGWPTVVIRDRFDGTLDLLAGLPVSGQVIARAKLAAIATLCLLGGVQIGGAVALVLPPQPTELRFAALVVGVGLGSWLCLTAGGFLLCALLTRYTSTQAMQRVGFASMAIIIGTPWLIGSVDPDGEALIRLLQTPPSLAVGVLVTLSVVVVLIALRLMAQGIDHFEPTPEAALM